MLLSAILLHKTAPKWSIYLQPPLQQLEPMTCPVLQHFSFVYFSSHTSVFPKWKRKSIIEYKALNLSLTTKHVCIYIYNVSLTQDLKFFLDFHPKFFNFVFSALASFYIAYKYTQIPLILKYI